jgi:hypothetical protein
LSFQHLACHVGAPAFLCSFMTKYYNDLLSTDKLLPDKSAARPLKAQATVLPGLEGSAGIMRP